MIVNKELYGEIEAYCELNELDVSKTLNEALRSGFTILQYGMGPNTAKPKERVVEVIKEVIKEVPVEKIVEVVKEVPVEVIKEVMISDDTKIDELLIKINDLENNNGQLTNEVKNLKVEGDKTKIDLVDCKKENTKLSAGGFDLYGER
jgi:hypothetical protein